MPAVRHQPLQVVDADDLVDPSDEGGDLDVDAGHVLPAAAEAPRDQPRQLVVTLVLAHQRAATVTLQIEYDKIRIFCCTKNRLMSSSTLSTKTTQTEQRP